MTHYINKAYAVAAIEKRLHKYEKEYEELARYEIWITAKEIEHKIKGLKEALSILDTLEVKEVDLVKGEDYINDLIGFFHQNNKLRNTKADIINWLKSFKE